jgi:hypothetical protein
LYEQPWHGSFPAFFTKELETSQHHVANGLGLTDREKLMSMTSVFGHNNTVMWYKRIFDNANITDITNTWPLFKAYMLSQHKNIAKGDGLKQADIYPQANAAAAPSCPSVDDQVNQAMAANRIRPAATYTAADLEEITVRACSLGSARPCSSPTPPSDRSQCPHCVGPETTLQLPRSLRPLRK